MSHCYCDDTYCALIETKDEKDDRWVGIQVWEMCDTHESATHLISLSFDTWMTYQDKCEAVMKHAIIYTNDSW